MCSHYQAVNPTRLQSHFQVRDIPLNLKHDLWPGYIGPFIRTQQDAQLQREVLGGSFGLIPHWATDTKIARNTYNARSETVAEKPSYRDAWRLARKCIIPADAIYEPDWRSGKAVSTQIVRADGKPMGIAGLWSAWQSPKGEVLHSFTMLTINADQHPFMSQFHKPTDEKRMVVILQDNDYDEWLSCDMNQARELLQPCDAEMLTIQSAAVSGTLI